MDPGQVWGRENKNVQNNSFYSEISFGTGLDLTFRCKGQLGNLCSTYPLAAQRKGPNFYREVGWIAEIIYEITSAKCCRTDNDYYKSSSKTPVHSGIPTCQIRVISYISQRGLWFSKVAAKRKIPFLHWNIYLFHCPPRHRVANSPGEITLSLK